MITEIALPSDRFSVQKLDNLKQKNFIYGKNGTGKSSITVAIKEQYGESHDVKIFQGFNSVADNERLDAISLGVQNAELQPQIEMVSKRIDEISLQVENGDLDNLYKQFEQVSKELENHKDELKPVVKQQLKFKDLEPYLIATNEILTKELVPSIILEFDSVQAEKWAKEGLDYHEAGGECVFCGNEVSSERLKNLNSYFDDQVKQFEHRISNAIVRISEARQTVNVTKKIDKTLFYPQFHEQIQTINLGIKEYVTAYINFLDILEKQLLERKLDLFSTKKEIVNELPENLDKTIAQYENICEENNLFSKNLSVEKQYARDKLRLSLVAKKLKDFDYNDSVIEEKILEEKFTRIKQNFETKQSELATLRKELKSLYSRSVDESIAANRINEYLGRLGEQSFQLILVDGEQKGQYSVQDLQGNKRSISTLSTGEKNIVAFLWFILDLENPDKLTEKQRIIVFDDPMNSNDDTMQYLIITSIQKLLQNLSDTDQVFILTHNIHFYTNVRYKWWNGSRRGNYEKTTIHLMKHSARSSFRLLTSEMEDLKTTYEALWIELHWLYEQDKPEFMLNPIRRIFETYSKFNHIDNRELYGENTAAEKLFNVNSHSVEDIEDFSSDPNGRSREEIMDIVKDIFVNNNAINHFNKHWPDE